MALELHPGPALEDVDHLEVDLVIVLIPSARTRGVRAMNMGPELAAGLLRHAEVAIVEEAPESSDPIGIAFVLNMKRAAPEGFRFEFVATVSNTHQSLPGPEAKFSFY